MTQGISCTLRFCANDVLPAEITSPDKSLLVPWGGRLHSSVRATSFHSSTIPAKCRRANSNHNFSCLAENNCFRHTRLEGKSPCRSHFPIVFSLTSNPSSCRTSSIAIIVFSTTAAIESIRRSSSAIVDNA